MQPTLTKPQVLEDVRDSFARLGIDTSLDTRGLLVILLPEDELHVQCHWTEGFYHLSERDTENLQGILTEVEEEMNKESIGA